MKLLSIIIPSYNMSKTIDRYLGSILMTDADPSKYEVIVVDSSTDDSPAVLSGWANKHGNLFVHHYDTRKTIGEARNLGVSFAQGEYIYCVDIDDYLYDRNVPTKVLNKLEADNGKYDIYFTPYKSIKFNRDNLRPVTTIKDLLHAPIGTMSKLYKRILYVEQPSYMPEDVCFHYLLIDKCET